MVETVICVCVCGGGGNVPQGMLEGECGRGSERRGGRGIWEAMGGDGGAR